MTAKYFKPFYFLMHMFFLFDRSNAWPTVFVYSWSLNSHQINWNSLPNCIPLFGIKMPQSFMPPCWMFTPTNKIASLIKFSLGFSDKYTSISTAKAWFLLYKIIKIFWFNRIQMDESNTFFSKNDSLEGKQTKEGKEEESTKAIL